MQNYTQENRLSGFIALLGLLTILIGLVILVVLPTIIIAAWMTLALGVALLVIAVILDFRKVRRAVTGSRGRFSTGTTVMVSVFIGIALLANAISIGNFGRFDLTGLSQFTLTSQTKDVMNNMTMPVKAIEFFVPNDQYGIADYATTLLDEYKALNPLLTVEKIDPDEHPDQAREYGVIQYQTVVFESDLGQRAVLPGEILQQAEHSFTSAILEVTGVAQKKIYFITGHGESDINGDYLDAKQGLLDNLYNVETLDLLTAGGIPDDATALVLANPQKPLSSEEFAILRNYLDNNGWLMALVNPSTPQEIKDFLAEYHVTIGDGTVIDPDSYLAPNLSTVIVPRTRDQFGLGDTYFPGATAVTPQEDYPDDIVMIPIVYTSTNSWMEADYDPLQEPVFNPETENRGAQAIGVFIVKVTPDMQTMEEFFASDLTRIVVMGDSDFASAQNFYEGDNGNLFLNSIELLTVPGKELISIERKVLPFRRMLVEPEEQAFIQISSVGLLPALVLIGGGVLWWRRRQ